MTPGTNEGVNDDVSSGLPDAAPLVSVIIIFLDAHRYMADAIESVLGQTLGAWELVLVDDGSSDGSREIAESYAARYPEQIRIVEHEGRRNLGTGPSRNLGMQVARGRYLTFLDADDIYEPTRLARPVALLEADPALGVVLSRDLYWRSWQPRSSRYASLGRLPDEIIGPNVPTDEVMPPPVLIAATLATRGAAMPAVCGITFRRQSILDHGGIPDQFTSQYEDQALIVKLLLHCSAIAIEDCLARYRQHPESLTHRARDTGEYRPGQPHEERHRFVTWLIGYLRENGIDEPVMIGALNAELEARHDSVSLAIGSAVRRVRRAMLVTADALLPRALLENLVGRYLARGRNRATRLAASRVAMISAGIRRGDSQ